MVLPAQCLDFFSKIIESEIGIIYSDVNYYQLESRLDEIATQLGLSSAVEFWEKTKTNGLDEASKMLLLDVATNNETMFFRDPKVFRAIETILAEKNSTTSSPVRIWSAASSTGQEVYSLAILCLELSASKPFYASIYATDVSERVLQRAQEGRYTQLEVQRGLSAQRLIKYFNQVPHTDSPDIMWEVKPNLRSSIKFEKLNLLRPWNNHDKFDLILCRNVLIYQTIENKTKVIGKLIDNLSAGGYLVLGGAESLVGITSQLVWGEINGAVLYRKPDHKMEFAS